MSKAEDTLSSYGFEVARWRKYFAGDYDTEYYALNPQEENVGFDPVV